MTARILSKPFVVAALVATSSVAFAQESPAPTQAEAVPQPETPADAAAPVDDTAVEAPAEPVAPAEATEPAVMATEPAPAPASAPAAAAKDPMLAIGPHVGVMIPQLFGELGAWPIFGLEIGYILPFDATATMRRPLQLTLDVLYTQPGAKGTEDGPALGEDGQTFDWKLREKILVFELGGLWRFAPPGEGLSPFASLGGRMYLMESVMTAESGGEVFGENRETKTQFGFVVGGGAEYALGPGAIFGALEIGWSDLKQRVTGDSNTGALVVDLGYRFLF